MTFAAVEGAGHMVPMDQPAAVSETHSSLYIPLCVNLFLVCLFVCFAGAGFVGPPCSQQAVSVNTTNHSKLCTDNYVIHQDCLSL